MTDLARWQDLLSPASALLGGAPNPEELARLAGYLALIEKWNRKINLTGSRDPHALAEHVLDCLALIPHLPAEAQRGIDVGSGAGLPGVVLAIMRPSVELTALEPIHKKHAFLNTVRRELGLTNLLPQCQRIEVHRHEPGYDFAVSRATFALPAWLEQGRALVRVGGRVLGMEGSEQHDLPGDARRCPYQVPGTDRRRAIIVLHV
ncbi:16S rRNA (guanine(527)-N(7))-methyltransferase RsmG [Haliangium sp.]|uniref:16S rRNA (guanine(527)-N(7))-methyltransferase RsmG n=1 Tax=Haliangium sp. TaxID=2663208 RepID=UPI003D0F2A09